MTDEVAKRFGRRVGRAFGGFVVPWTCGAVLIGVGFERMLSTGPTGLTVASTIGGAVTMALSWVHFWREMGGAG